MSPNLALGICLLFIVYIMRVETRQKINVSAATLIPLLWIIIAASRPFSSWLYPEGIDVGTTEYETGNPIDRVYFSALILFSAFVLVRRRVNWGEVIRKNAWLVALTVYAGLTIIWSDFAGVSFKRWIRGLGVILSVLVILTEQDPAEATQRVLRRCMYVLIPFSVLYIKYFRHLGVGWDYFGKTMWYGVTTHKNSLGQLACVSSIFFLWSAIKNRKNKNSLFWADLSNSRLVPLAPQGVWYFHEQDGDLPFHHCVSCVPDAHGLESPSGIRGQVPYRCSTRRPFSSGPECVDRRIDSRKSDLVLRVAIRL